MIPFPKKKFKVILADPPWSYDNKNTGGSMVSGASHKYNTMTLDEICNIPIDQIADKNCALFLWATVPLLPEAFKVMEAWGFKYKTALVWRKIMSLGLGFWFRGQIEILLLGIKGKVKAFHCQKPNFIQSKVEKHSKKPDQFYGLIESIGLKPRIELFARQRRDEWTSWGNEISKDTQRKLK